MIGPIINGITKGIANQNITNLAQDTIAQVGIETTLKAIGRPAAILVDKDISPDTKQYAASKEFLYQVTCLLVYMGAVYPFFRKGAFKLAKNHLFKHKPEFQKFENAKEYGHYLKLTKKDIPDRKLTLQKQKVKDKYHDDIRKELENNPTPDIYPLIKGSIDMGNIIGSVLGLAIFAPQISHAFIHPVLRAIGLEDKEGKTKKFNTNA